MLTTRLYRILCLIFIFTLAIAGCKSKPQIQQSARDLAAIKVKRIAVMPFIRGLPDTRIDQPMRRLLYCSVANLCFNIKELKANADELMTRNLQDALQKKYGEQLVPLQIVQPAYSGLPKNPYSDTPPSLAVALGRKLDADHIMVGTVWRYQERIGSATGSPHPASVAFALYVLNVETGMPVWEAAYEKTQQSLSENILNYKEFFNMGARWLTADELARYGIDQVLGVTQQ
jgi:hypothetical protein